MSEQTLYKVGFTFGDSDFQSVTLATSPDDDETIEQYLMRKLNGTAQRNREDGVEEARAGSREDAAVPKFAAFGDGADGFTLINTQLLTKVSVRKITESA